MPPTTQVNSATLIMGVTGSGKSSLIATLAKYVWKRWQKTTRYYTADGGGFPAKIQELQAVGIIEVFRMATRDNEDGLSFETCYRACQGWWPKRINPATGEVLPGVEMVPPIAVAYKMSCPAGHPVKTVPAESLLTPTPCPTCKLMVTKANMLVQKTIGPNQGFERLGAVAYDGLTSMLSWEMRELGRRAGRMELKGEEAAIGGKVVSGDLKFGGTTRSHVGFAQTRGEELVHLTLGIPNLVVPPIFTALTHEDVDERALSITGPKIAGRAKTDEAPQWFGNVLETAKIPAPNGVQEQRVVYLSEFIDGTGRRHLCKNRAAPGTLPAVLMDPPGGDTDETLAFTQVNLGLFFAMLDDALQKGIQSTLAEFPDAPGLPEGIVEIGGARVIQGEAVTPPAGVEPAGPQPLTPRVASPRVTARPRVASRQAPASAVPPPVPAVASAPIVVEAVVEPPQVANVAPEATAGAVSPAAPVPVPAPAPPVQVQAPAPVARPAGIAAPPGRRPVASGSGVTVTGPAARPVASVPKAPAPAPRPPAGSSTTP